MIDMNKKYTYNGKPVRIYADGSDTEHNYIHIAYFHCDVWNITSVHEKELIEVWEPVIGEWVWKDTEFVRITAIRNYNRDDGLLTYSCSVPCRGESFSSSFKPERFIGTLPEAFKGL